MKSHTFIVALLWLGISLGGCESVDIGKITLPTATPKPTPTSTSTPVVTPTPSPVVTPTPQVYVVQQGDTLWSIAQRFKIDVESLVQLTELGDPTLLQPGQQLVITGRITASGRPLPTATPTPLRCLDGCRQPTPGCDVKGVIASLDVSRLYLLPSDDIYLYRAAVLWFCTTEDAERAGWKRWTSNGPR